jgi:nitrous oxide reductase accessory protein NosL
MLALAGTGIVAGLAGCSGNGESADGGNGESSDGDTDAGGDDGAEGESTTDELSEPAAFPADANCPVCNMVPADHEKWNAQLAHENGHRAYFDTSGCMAAYMAYTDRFGGPDSEMESAWVTGFETEELIDATTAHFVRVTENDHVDDIMKKNPTPFADRADAEAFVERFDTYSQEDIIRLDAFDKELAKLYRGPLIEKAASGSDGGD